MTIRSIKDFFSSLCCVDRAGQNTRLQEQIKNIASCILGTFCAISATLGLAGISVILACVVSPFIGNSVPRLIIKKIIELARVCLGQSAFQVLNNFFLNIPRPAHFVTAKIILISSVMFLFLGCCYLLAQSIFNTNKNRCE